MRNFEAFSTELKIVMVVVFTFGVSGFSSCSRSLDSICTKEFPKFMGDLKIAQARAGEINPGTEGRGPAGTQENQDRTQLTAGEQIEWKRWIEREISGAQELMAFAEDKDFPPQQIAKIHRLSNQLVVFWGNIDKGKYKSLSRSLAAIERESRDVQKTFCSK